MVFLGKGERLWDGIPWSLWQPCRRAGLAPALKQAQSKSGHLSLLTSVIKVTFPEAAGYQDTSAGSKDDCIDPGWTMCLTAPSPFLPHISKEDHFRC